MDRASKSSSSSWTWMNVFLTRTSSPITCGSSRTSSRAVRVGDGSGQELEFEEALLKTAEEDSTPSHVVWRLNDVCLSKSEPCFPGPDEKGAPANAHWSMRFTVARSWCNCRLRSVSNACITAWESSSLGFEAPLSCSGVAKRPFGRPIFAADPGRSSSLPCANLQARPRSHRPRSMKSAHSRVLEKSGCSRSWELPCAKAQLEPRVQAPTAKNLQS
mmetsp:Transcript_41380/g.96618  ORF Transcript_41380/g.96618 Transcript_41380/m.96618 type:complete len:217 (-) Transcript_41380:160-810(-)